MEANVLRSIIPEVTRIYIKVQTQYTIPLIFYNQILV